MKGRTRAASTDDVGQSNAAAAVWTQHFRFRDRSRRSPSGFSWVRDFPFAAPAVVLITVFFLLPNLLVMVLSFTSWNSYVDDIGWTGWANIQELVANGVLWSDLGATFQYGIAVVVLENVIALSLALALERPTAMNTILRTIFFIPLLLSPVAAGFIFEATLNIHGPLNQLLTVLFGAPFQFNWFGSTIWTVYVVAFVHAWKYLGLTLLVYLAGLAAVPADMVEAARVDGAGRLRTLWNVKLRMMSPAITFNVVIGMIGAFNTADIVLATTNGGPGRTTELAQVFVIQQFGQGYFGTASAMSLAALVMVTIVAIPLIVFLRRNEVEA